MIEYHKEAGLPQRIEDLSDYLQRRADRAKHNSKPGDYRDGVHDGLLLAVFALEAVLARTLDRPAPPPQPKPEPIVDYTAAGPSAKVTRPTGAPGLRGMKP